MRQLLFVSSFFFSLAHLLSSWFPPPSFLLPPAPWKDLVIPVGSKCDTSSRSSLLLSPLNPHLGCPATLPPCPSLRSVCFGPCHRHGLCDSSHDGGEPSLANYHTPDESQRERNREKSYSAIFGPWHRLHKRLSPPLFAPLISGPPQQMKQAHWGGPQSLGPLLFIGLVLTAACFGLCHTHKHSCAVFEFEGLSWQALHVLWHMINVIMVYFTLFCTRCQKRSLCFLRARVIWLFSVWTAVMSTQH